MPQPTASDVHVDQILTNISTAYLQDAMNYVAMRVFPVVPVQKQTDKYFKFDKNTFLLDQMQRRGPAEESAGSGYTLSTDNYSCDVWALHKDVDDQTRQNTDNPLDPDRNATQYLTQQAMTRLETQFNTDFMTTSIWGTDSTPTNLWSDYTASDPIGDIETAKDAILGVTGMDPNTLVLGYSVFRQLKNHPDLIDRYKYTSSQVITTDLLGALFDIDRVMVARSVRATNVEGATAAYSYTVGKNALLAYTSPAPALEQATAGYTFMWQGISRGLGTNVGVKKFRMENLEADRIEIQTAWDNKVVSSDLGYFFNGAVA